jgi:hypothetical protein
MAMKHLLSCKPKEVFVASSELIFEGLKNTIGGVLLITGYSVGYVLYIMGKYGIVYCIQLIYLHR